jgi:two-component system OmpR family response regulator
MHFFPYREIISERPSRTLHNAADGEGAMSIRVLHIDDDIHIQNIVELSLGLDPEIEVTSCSTAKEGIAVAVNRAPDLILCDVCMPDMDGPAMLARLRENPGTADIPFVFLTANTRKREIEQLRVFGLVGVITKPFEPTKLAESVRDRLQSLREHKT